MYIYTYVFTYALANVHFSLSSNTIYDIPLAYPDRKKKTRAKIEYKKVRQISLELGSFVSKETGQATFKDSWLTLCFRTIQ